MLVVLMKLEKGLKTFHLLKLLKLLCLMNQISLAVRLFKMKLAEVDCVNVYGVKYHYPEDLL